MKRLPLLAGLLGLLLPAAASAQVSLGATQASGGLFATFTTFTGVPGFNELALLLVHKVWLLIGIAAVYNIVRAGISLINNQEEDKLTKARKTIGVSVAAVMAFYFVPRLVEAIYTANGPAGVFTSPVGVVAGATVFATEIYGVIRWVEVVIIPIAIALIVVSGLKAIASFGKEDGVTALRREVVAVAMGIVLLGLDPVIKATLGIPRQGIGMPGVPTTAPLFVRAVEIINELLLFLALIATAMVTYAGIRLIVSLGNEEGATAAKGTLFRTTVGMVVLFLSYALTSLAMSLIA